MKALRDLTVLRKDLQGWTDNLAWGPDGTLYITTVPDLTRCQPVYNKTVTNNSIDLFHVKEHKLSLPNKLEFENAQENIMLNSLPESFITQCQASPVNNLLAVVTNNGGVCIYENDFLISQLDEPGKMLNERTYHSVSWSHDGTMIATGNECGQVVLFSCNTTKGTCFEFKSSINLDDESKSWVTKLKWVDGNLLAALSNNAVFLINCDFTHTRIKEPSRFAIFDLCAIQSNILITTIGSVYRYELADKKADVIPWNGYEELYIVPVPKQNKAIIISNTKSCTLELNQGIRLSEDQILAPHLETKFRRWNSYFNELNNYETNLLIHGISISCDGASVALLYSIDRLSIRYRIVSEQVYRICILPLADDWEIRPESSGLAWYQNYQIYGKKLPSNYTEQAPSPELNVTVEFPTFLGELMSSDSMNILRFSNYFGEKPDNHLYKKAIYEYAMAHRDKITNVLDKACVLSISHILALVSPFEIDCYVMKSEFIEETFTAAVGEEKETVRSMEGHVWKRCAATFLPLLTPEVKICPVTGFRMIDLQKDHYNEYGWLTTSLLQLSNRQSIYSGTKMI
ncbi:LADA_0A06920g1_1 [Lachancea dasiensis]|uniref:LADA_0A06920g1_1 n=1 Tax=Lachancea dasiensis TaxID=1072105 RepID=A0A1G4IPR6_9SACH|nr:LADA_0A06920g1_1 [Lachancea dasiensis]